MENYSEVEWNCEWARENSDYFFIPFVTFLQSFSFFRSIIV